MFKKYFFVSFVFLLSIASRTHAESESQVGLENSSSTLVTRAAFDIGSGGIKVTVADVDLLTNHIAKIWDQTAAVTTGLRRDLAMSQDGLLSHKVQEELIDTLNALKERVNKFSPTQWTAIGTSVFRTAKNGTEFLEEIKSQTGLNIVIVPQNEEGEIGFASAVAMSEKNKNDLIVWDSGSGSFQITTYCDGTMEMYGAEFAMTPALEALFAIRGKPFVNQSVSPVSFEEAHLLAEAIRQKLPPTPSWIQYLDKQVVAIGGSSIFSRAAEALNKRTFTKKEVQKLIGDVCEKSDEELGQSLNSGRLAVSLILLYTVMDHCGIEELTYCSTNRSAEGLLITPRFWKM